MKKRIWLLFLGLILGLLLVACGQNEDTSESETDTDQTETETEEEETSSSSEITVTDMYGEHTIEEAPEKIVVLEWVYAENLLALGVQPVGMADIEGYNSWVNIDAELSDDVVDVGTRQEPNLEAISELEPDLIITAGFRHEAIMDSLNDITQTLAFNSYPEEGTMTQYEEMETTFKEMAKVVGKTDEAESVLQNLDSSYEEIEQEITDAEIENNQFVLAQAFSSDAAPVIRLFKDNAMATEIMTKIGLENAYESEGFQVYGFDSASVEALQNFQDAHFFYIVQEDDNIFENQLAGNPAWEGLGFVEENRTYQLPGDTWTFGGPLSAKVFAEQIKEALVSAE
ncbi:ABC transporter substrate-binding protein [Saliterribacillus persicus]|uniref:Iron complex transport system substrate-binding protein n=1 Tax=Saliterribacillus persicus TaxID=930114 RepID=A0A368XKL3_9BACI|nr:iron-siderophore ABC transporter substrate-binding protein [Saliterribacillus persicus]RCW67037.1 iron complex transport system substrate-binding protein [Saliterribacillus persicus]